MDVIPKSVTMVPFLSRRLHCKQSDRSDFGYRCSLKQPNCYHCIAAGTEAIISWLIVAYALQKSEELS